MKWAYLEVFFSLGELSFSRDNSLVTNWSSTCTSSRILNSLSIIKRKNLDIEEVTDEKNERETVFSLLYQKWRSFSNKCL